MEKVIYEVSLFTEHDIYLFKEGSHLQIYEKLGSHPLTRNGMQGTYFAVWAPNARAVGVIGDFNEWNANSHPLKAREDQSGIWEGFIPGVQKGALYKYHISSAYHTYPKYKVDKADPFAFSWELSPRRSSRVWNLSYDWKDEEWMKGRSSNNALDAPFAVYEVHLGSWQRVPEENCRFLTYREMAVKLASYAKEMGFTHLEIMPIMEHPFYGSWGYQTIGYFAPTSRYGRPEDFMYFVDYLHQQGLAVIIDWVPSHFSQDGDGLSYFDGTHLYEHTDPRKGFHPDWKSCIFNYSRNEVRSFLLSNALFWLEKYHVDGLRLDGVASMLYLDYSRKSGEWIPNEYGGRENLEAISFLKSLNEKIYKMYPDIQVIAEESTAWPMVSRPVHLGGLGFGMKWNMGWMHDTLEYFSHNPLYRKYHHNQLSFSLWYHFYENFMLSLSHDEVVYGKGSLLSKMPGDDWQKFANLRLLFGYMYGHPGKKLLFMGGEFGQWAEWYHEKSLDWHLLRYDPHKGIQRWVKDLNLLYRNQRCLHELDFNLQGFEWIDFSDWQESIISFLRKAKSTKETMLVVCNFTPVVRYNYKVGVPEKGVWTELLNSDSQEYGGSNIGNAGGAEAIPLPHHSRNYSLNLTLPPLGILFFKKNNAEKNP